jgi:hypothetical protein
VLLFAFGEPLAEPMAVKGTHAFAGLDLPGSRAIASITGFVTISCF